MDDYEVIITGAGPVGLMLAGELRLHGVRTLVLERLTEPDLTVKAGSLNTPTAEACYRRGLLPQLAEAQRGTLELITRFAAASAPKGADAAAMPKFKGPSGHFGGLMHLDVERLDRGDDPDLEPSPASEVVLVSQQAMEKILGEWAEGLGAEIRRGAELAGFDQDQSGVSVELVGGQRIHAQWLVGCDGGRSLVRKLGGIEFPGTDPLITGHQAVVDIQGAEKLPRGWNHVANGVLVHGPTPGRILTVEYDGPPADRDAPITLAELETSLRNVSGEDVRITGVHSATRFTDNARQAATYRSGRVLLAGDAAHVHSPFGGQGLNLGVGDAVNLGWKLAATLHGWAPEGLLDSYTAERHPIGEWVLDWTRAQVALMHPGAHHAALRAVITDLMHTDDGNDYFLTRIAGFRQRYDLGGGHPLVGRRTPDPVLGNGSRLAEHCHAGRAVLLDRTADGVPAAVAAGWADRVEVVADPCDAAPAGLLVRPDGYIAWAADSVAGKEEMAELETALSRWLGPADPSAQRGAA
ncbi:MAG TPA: FAD-dependent monooxygenase [Pseudonocardiaceae bacterium]|nr:FAD-dependent monooxygenase [Pseudonocardiaceae bacterium]